MRIGQKHTEEWKAKYSIGGWNKGLPNPHAKNLPHAFKKGFTPWNKGLKAGDAPGIRSGERINTWRGGVTPINAYQRKTLDYKNWRKAVFERDNYTCVFCGAQNGKGKTITLQADHIKPFALYPELRLAIDNGRTLCKPCHTKTDTYGRFSLKAKQNI